VIRYRFGQDDLLRTRFAIAPLMELVGAVYARRDPARFVVHQPWAEWTRPRTEQLDLSLLDIATPFGTPFWPVFVGPPPRTPHASVDDELERVRATPPERVVAEIKRTYPGGVPQGGQRFVDDPTGTLAELVEQMRAFWDAALAPWWTSIAVLLESEIASRARRLVAVGAQAAFTDLHPTVYWDQGVLYVHPTNKAPADVDLAGRGLLLAPRSSPGRACGRGPTHRGTQRWSIRRRGSLISGCQTVAAMMRWNRCWVGAARRSCSSWIGRPPPWSSPGAWGSARAV
jgi:hypothetical protein